MIHWRRKWQLTPVFLLQELHEIYEKAKHYDTGRWAPMSESIKYITGEEWRTIANSSRKNEEAGQSRNDAQLWICLVVKVKSDAIKNNIA